MNDKSEIEGRLSRWSRLKQEEKKEEHVAAVAPGAMMPAEGEGEEVPEIAPEDLPDVESLTAESDFTPFMQKGVPEHLKRLALRKLWGSDPVLANLDGLNDYDDDYTIVETIAGALKSAYQAGKGYADEAEEATEAVAAADPEKEADKGEETAAVDAEGAEGSTPTEPVDDGDVVVDNSDHEEVPIRE